MSPKLWIIFGINLDGRPVTEFEVRSKDALGITLEGEQIPGKVSLYEEHDCRIEAGYTLVEWYNLSGYERAIEIAHYRIRHSIDYHKNLKQERQMKAQSAKG